MNIFNSRSPLIPLHLMLCLHCLALSGCWAMQTLQLAFEKLSSAEPTLYTPGKKITVTQCQNLSVVELNVETVPRFSVSRLDQIGRFPTIQISEGE